MNPDMRKRLLVVLGLAVLAGCGPPPCPADATLILSRTEPAVRINAGFTLDGVLPIAREDAYRVAYYPSIVGGGESRVVRVHRDGAEAVVEVAQPYLCSTAAAYGFGVVLRSRRLTTAAWRSVVECFEESGFWNLPLEGHGEPCCDGSGVRIEAVRAGRRHRIGRANLDQEGTYCQDPSALPVKACLHLIKSAADDDG